MNQDVGHARAQELIAREFVEGIPASDQRWLEEHLRGCEECAAAATSTDRALRALKSVAVQVPTGLAQRTQFRVRLRAQEARSAEAQRNILWLACGASWVFGAVSAPWVWRGLLWAGKWMALPRVVPELGFGLWWALPAIVAGAIVFAEHVKSEMLQDWFRQQDRELR